MVFNRRCKPNRDKPDWASCLMRARLHLCRVCASSTIGVFDGQRVNPFPRGLSKWAFYPMCPASRGRLMDAYRVTDKVNTELQNMQRDRHTGRMVLLARRLAVGCSSNNCPSPSSLMSACSSQQHVVSLNNTWMPIHTQEQIHAHLMFQCHCPGQSTSPDAPEACRESPLSLPCGLRVS